MGGKKSMKRFGRSCPDCETGYLVEVIHKENISGVIYEEKYLECTECSYEQKIRISEKRYKDLFNPKF
jgi:hypothetical protein